VVEVDSHACNPLEARFEPATRRWLEVKASSFDQGQAYYNRGEVQRQLSDSQRRALVSCLKNLRLE
jgi:hypothetical protein